MNIDDIYIYNKYRTTHTHIVEYSSATKMKENLPVVTTQMDLKDIMLSEIGQRKTNTVSLICRI